MQHLLETYFETLRNKRVYIVGIGVSNTPLIEKMLEFGLNVTACDKREREAFDGLIDSLEGRGLKVFLGFDYLDHLEDADVVFRTPGMRPDLPQLVQAVERGAELTSEMEVFFELCPCRTIAITGSDGKTTTTTIISGLLEAAGYRVFTGGNIGRPLLCDVDSMLPDDIAVVELSSFQLMTMKRSASIAVVTNLAPNHLDVHKNMQEYIDAKRNIFAHQESEDKVVLNADNKITAAFAEEARGEVVMFSRKKILEHGICLKDDKIVNYNRPVLGAEDIRLPGLHNLENYMAAIAAVDELVPEEVIVEFARSFRGVAHRIEWVRELDGVQYYNDSIASSPSRTIAGLRSFNKKVILIAGGYDKQIPYDDLGPQIVESVKVLILTGATAEKIRSATLGASGYSADALLIVDCEDLKTAVDAAKTHAVPGDVVILSPASASFDCFKNFEDRGNTFKRFVNQL